MDLLIIFIIVLLLFGYPAHRWGSSRGWGYGPVGIIIVIILVLVLLRFVR